MADEMTANELDVLATDQTNDQSYGSSAVNDYGSRDESIDLGDILAETGISDPSNIVFENSDGSLVTRDWNDLSRNEQMNIIKSSASNANQLSNEEAEFLNHVRKQGMSPVDYVRSISNAVAESASEPPSYAIDDLSDDELFILDAIDRFGNEYVTDEQLETLLSNAKSDPNLYAMTINSLRNQYADKEDELRVRQQETIDAVNAQQFADFRENILDEIQSLRNIAGQEVDLTVEDMNDLANYVLTKDETGQTQFSREMSDPRLFTRAAFWALKGDDLMNEISSQIRMAYERGVEVGSRGRSQLAFNTRQDNKASSDYMAGDLDVR